jgi:hypothetical protein
MDGKSGIYRGAKKRVGHIKSHEANRLRGRPRCRLGNNIKVNLKEMWFDSVDEVKTVSG